MLEIIILGDEILVNFMLLFGKKIYNFSTAILVWE